MGFTVVTKAAAEYELSRNHENQLRREEELRQQAENKHLRQQQAANQGQQRVLPKGRRPYQEPPGGPEQHYLGPMNIRCSHCHALHFDSEKLTSSTRANKKFGGCCLQGQIMLPQLPPPPRELKELLYGINPFAHHFKE